MLCCVDAAGDKKKIDAIIISVNLQQPWEAPYTQVLPGFHFWTDWLEEHCSQAPEGMRNCFMAGGGGWLFMETSQVLVRTGFLSMSISLVFALLV